MHCGDTGRREKYKYITNLYLGKCENKCQKVFTYEAQLLD